MITRSRSARLALFAFTTALCSGLAAPAFAQAGPPVYDNTDENGIDVVTGAFSFSMVEGSIGAGDSELDMIRYYGPGPYFAPVFTDNWEGTHMLVSPGPTLSSGNVAAVALGNRTETFTRSGTSWTSDQGNGSTLEEMSSGGLYQYRSSKGFVIRFGAPSSSPTFCSTAGQTYCVGLPLTRTEPSGRAVTYSWQLIRNCTGTCMLVDYRIGSVSNNAGYALTAAYASNGPTLDPDWHRRTSVVFQNTVTPISAPPTITYSYPSTGVTEVTDTGGRTWRFTESMGRMVGIRRPGATSSADTTTINIVDGQITGVTRDGVTTGYSRDSSYAMVVTHPIAGQTVVASNYSVGRPSSITDPLGRVTSYTYDSQTRLAQTTYPEGNKVALTYDARGNVTETRSISKTPGTPPDIVSAAVFPSGCTNAATCDEPTMTIDPKSQQTDYTYDSTTGLVTSVTAPQPTTGAVRPQKRYSYTTTGGVALLTGTSACQTLASCAGLADETKSTFLYDANLQPVSTSTGSGDGVLTATTTVGYDAVGNEISSDGPLAGTADTTVTKYDAAREVVGVILPDPDGVGALKNRAFRRTYNADGQVTLAETGTTSGQSDTNWAAFATLQQLASTYDANGRKVSDTTTAGGTTYGVTQYSYDLRGRIDCTTTRMNSALWGSLPASACNPQTAGSSGPDRIGKTSYDAADQVTKVQSAYGITGVQADEVTATYNDNGTLKTVTDAENNQTAYYYDGVDRLVKTEFPSATKGAGASNASNYEQLTYDANSNVTVRRLRDGNSILYFYDLLNRLTTKFPGSDPVVTFTYDLLNHPLTAATSAQTVTMGWDALGRNTSQTNPVGTVGYQYDLAGRRTRMTWPDSFYVAYEYDSTDNLTAIKESGTTSLAAFSYDDLGRRTQLLRGNGVSTNYTFDNASRLTNMVSNPAGTTYDLTLGFGYNNAGQIAQTTRSNDVFSWTGAANVARAYTANGLNQFTVSGAVSLGYDARGNLTSSGSDSYTYSSENLLLTGPSSASLSYDPLMRLYEVSNSTTSVSRFLYDGTQLIAGLNSSGAYTRRFVTVPGSDELIAEYKPMSGTVYWKLTDERGSVIAAVDSSGNTSSPNTYDEYGIPGSGNAGRYQYTGQIWLPEVGLYYYKARMYSPTLGRFMQSDPIGYIGGMNRYNYVGSDPVNATDPSGSICFPNGDGLDGAKGGGGCSQAGDIIINGFLSASNSLSFGLDFDANNLGNLGAFQTPGSYWLNPTANQTTINAQKGRRNGTGKRRETGSNENPAKHGPKRAYGIPGYVTDEGRDGQRGRPRPAKPGEIGYGEGGSNFSVGGALKTAAVVVVVGGAAILLAPEIAAGLALLGAVELLAN